MNQTPSEAPSCNCNYIKDTVCKIDRLQKSAVCSSASQCILCETSLISSAYNTIPVSFNTCCGNSVLANIGTTGDTSTFFRIEAIRCQRFATLRVLQNTDGALTETEYTTTIDLDCVGQIQCYEPISVTLCQESSLAD